MVSEGRKKFAEFPKNLAKKTFSFRRRIFLLSCFNGQKNSSFDHPTENVFCLKDNFFEINVHKMPKTSAHHPQWMEKKQKIKKMFLESFVVKRRKNFWPSATKVSAENRKLFAHCPNIFGSMSKSNTKRVPSSKKSYLKFFP